MSRIKGIDCFLRLIGPGGPVAITKIGKLDVNFLGEILTEEYVGEAAPDFDEIDMGVDVKFSFHYDTFAAFTLIQQIINRRKRIGDLTARFSAMGVFKLPEFGTRKIVIPNLCFGPIPMGVAGRKQYLHTEIDGKAKAANFI